MKIIFRILLIISIAIGAFISCDDIEEPFIEAVGDCGDASLPVPIKQILIEEFTGHKCGNCPRGDETIKMIKELYCDHVIPVSIHAGSFADVNETGNYTYEYRTEDGNELNEYFGGTSNGVPGAIINRTKFNNTYAQSEVSTWLTYADSLIKALPMLDIISTTQINNDSRELEIDLDIVFVNSVNDHLMLSIYFVEDSIVSWQKDYSEDPSDIEYYTHNHVFRDAINGAFGEEILNGDIHTNDVINRSYKYNVSTKWKIENSSIIAFVYKYDTKEVLQASQIYINK